VCAFGNAIEQLRDDEIAGTYWNMMLDEQIAHGSGSCRHSRGLPIDREDDVHGCDAVGSGKEKDQQAEERERADMSPHVADPRWNMHIGWPAVWSADHRIPRGS
jgi:hypothetical protein